MTTDSNSTQTTAENCISDELADVLERLSLDQIRFVIARQECATAREAAKQIGVSESTVYRWPEDVELAVRLMATDGITTALHLRRRALAKAMAVKIAGLDSNRETTRQSVATEIIEWELGRATQRAEMTGKGGEPLRLEVVWDESPTPQAT